MRMRPRQTHRSYQLLLQYYTPLIAPAMRHSHADRNNPGKPGILAAGTSYGQGRNLHLWPEFCLPTAAAPKLARLDHWQPILGIFAMIFAVKSRVFIAVL